MKQFVDFGAILKKHERDVLQQAMEWNGWNKSKTAKAMGWSRGCLHYKLRQHFGNMYDRNGVVEELRDE